ncbi:MAG: polyprenyl synthetase family protein [Candidatus Hydrogenedentes bacterium]|nr:polyprenyl synthetase family protein [Candidatus Hydrogenedentota bacterium]
MKVNARSRLHSFINSLNEKDLWYDPPMATALNLTSLYGEINTQLERVRTAVRDQWVEAFQLVYGPAATPPRLGGKLIRPALCFMSAGAVGAHGLDRFVDMATAMELLHLAALAHDDVVDRADVRRGEPSLNRLWDNHTAVLGGDYMVARALDILTNYDSTSVIKSALESIHQMAEGELINFGRKQGTLNEDDCIRLAEKKTASLFAVACSTPSILIDESHRADLFNFGMGIGTAFQLIDDLLDLEQGEETLGKPSCGDIVEGKMTLPILYMRAEMSDADVQRLENLAGGPVSEDDRAWIRESIRSTGALERTEAQARTYIERARAALEALPENAFTTSMLGMTEFVLSRDA